MYSQRLFASKSDGNVSKRSAEAVNRAANGRKEPARFHFIDFPPPGRPSSCSRSVRHSRRWDDRSLFTAFYCPPPLLPLPLPHSRPLHSAISPSFCSSHASFIFPLLSAYFFSPPPTTPPPLPLSLSSCGCQRWNDDHLQPSCKPPPTHSPNLLLHTNIWRGAAAQWHCTHICTRVCTCTPFLSCRKNAQPDQRRRGKRDLVEQQGKGRGPPDSRRGLMAPGTSRHRADCHRSGVTLFCWAEGIMWSY